MDALPAEDIELMRAAHATSHNAYAPYSNFYVGAALLMENGEVCVGNNQENAAYPSGICAERVAIFSASALHPNLGIKKIAVVAHSNQFVINKPITPCGSCRQVLAEYEKKFNQDIKVLMMGETGKVYEVASVKEILPLMFTADDLENK
jgi:cytidine deaminase